MSEPAPDTAVPADVRAIAVAAARSVGVQEPLESGAWSHQGTSSHVLLIGDAAVRIGRNAAAGDRILRSQCLVDALPGLPFAVPRSLGEPLLEQGLVAVPTARLRGEPHPAHSGESGPLRALLETVAAIDPGPLEPHLAHPREFLGGEGWQARVGRDAIGLFPERWRGEAQDRLDALAALPAPERPTFRHGDLGGANVLWEGGTVTGVLDWDLAAIDDPAEDVASLVWWHGWKLLPEVTDAETARRAEVFRRSFPVQTVAFAQMHETDPAQVQRSLERSVRVLERETSADA